MLFICWICRKLCSINDTFTSSDLVVYLFHPPFPLFELISKYDVSYQLLGDDSWQECSGSDQNSQETGALWARITENTDCSTGPLARPFARSLAPDCSLCSRPPLCSLVSLACSLRSLPRSWESNLLFILCFFLIWTIVHGPEQRKTTEKESN